MNLANFWAKKKKKKEIKLNQRDKPLLNKQILRFNIISNRFEHK